MTDFLLCFSFLPVPSGSGSSYAPSAVVQLVIALILAAWLLQLVRLAFLVFQWRKKASARASFLAEMDVSHISEMEKETYDRNSFPPDIAFHRG
jgi:hypothetical protein